MASGVGRGDAVITVSHTFIATVEAISQAGAETEFVDIDARTYCMGPDALDEYLGGCATDSATGRPVGKRTGKPIKAIVPVHLYGQVADMDAILAIAAKYGTTGLRTWLRTSLPVAIDLEDRPAGEESG